MIRLLGSVLFWARQLVLSRQIVSRLRRGVVDEDLKHGETALQFNGAVLCAFLGAELRLQPSIDFEGETGFRRFDRSAAATASGYGESGTADKPVPMRI